MCPKVKINGLAVAWVIWAGKILGVGKVGGGGLIDETRSRLTKRMKRSLQDRQGVTC